MWMRYLSMQKTKIIKGSPIYHYHGKNLLEKPKSLLISKMLYDADENITHVYLRHRNYIYDILILCIIIFITYLIKTNNLYSSVKFYYNSVVTYYDNALFLNIKNSEDSSHSISYIIEDNGKVVISGKLNPGEYIIKANVDTQSDELILKLSYTDIFGIHENDFNLYIIQR